MRARPAPDLWAVRRRAAELIERDGHAVVDECGGPHGPRPRRPEIGARCASCGVADALLEMGFQPGITTAETFLGIATRLCDELGAGWFPYGPTLHYWNNYSTGEEVVAGLRGEVV